MEDGRLLKAELADTAAFDRQIEFITQKMEVVAGLIKQCIDDNASSAMDQEKYAKRYDGLVERYEKQKCKLESLQAEKAEREFKEEILSGFLFKIIELSDMDTAFQPVRFSKAVDHITVYNDGGLVFTFFVGKEIAVEL